MEFSNVISVRRTFRDFSHKEVPINVIEKALEAGLKAPSYNHLKQSDFILVNDRDMRLALTKTEDMPEQVSEEMAAAFSTYEKSAKDMYLDAVPKQKRMIMNAPGLLVVVYKPKTQIKESKRVYDLNCFASVWCCIENILLSFAEDNVFGVTFIPKNTPAVKKALRIPSSLEVATIIPFGYKSPDAHIIPQKHVELSERLHNNHW